MFSPNSILIHYTAHREAEIVRCLLSQTIGMGKDGFLHLLTWEIEPSRRLRGDNKDTEALAIIPLKIRDLLRGTERNLSGTAFFK